MATRMATAPCPFDADAGVIDAVTSTNPMRHDDHHAVEPPAAGSRAAELITTGLLFVSAALSWIAFVDVGFMHHDVQIALFPGSFPATCRSTGRCGSIR